MKVYLGVFVFLFVVSTYLQTGQSKAALNRIVMNPNEARSFASKGGGKLRLKRWFFYEEKNLYRECYVEENGCQFEEVMEYYQPTNTTAAEVYWNTYQCDMNPDTCDSSSPSVAV